MHCMTCRVCKACTGKDVIHLSRWVAWTIWSDACLLDQITYVILRLPRYFAKYLVCIYSPSLFFFSPSAQIQPRGNLQGLQSKTIKSNIVPNTSKIILPHGFKHAFVRHTLVHRRYTSGITEYSKTGYPTNIRLFWSYSKPTFQN